MQTRMRYRKAARTALGSLALICLSGLDADAVAAMSGKPDMKARFLEEMKAVRSHADTIEQHWCRLFVETAAQETAPRVLRFMLKQAVFKKDLHFEVHQIAGQWESPVGWTPGWNGAEHTVRPRAFKVERDAAGRGTFTGEVLVVLRPDGYVPLDLKPLECAFRISATMTGGTLTGDYATFVAA